MCFIIQHTRSIKIIIELVKDEKVESIPINGAFSATLLRDATKMVMKVQSTRGCTHFDLR